MKNSVSIITVTLNAERQIEKTLLSVLSQNYDHLEYVIIDGGSTDGTLKIVEKYKSGIDKIISEPDRGISHAFNKGLGIAGGRWVNFLNAGDVFMHPDVVARSLGRAGEAKIVTGFARHGRKTIPKRRVANETPLHRRALLSHQASFVSRDVFRAVGGFDEDYAIRMDYEFWLRALPAFRLLFLDEVLVDYDAGKSSENLGLFYEEEIRANQKHLRFPQLPCLVSKAKFLVKCALHQ